MLEAKRVVDRETLYEKYVNPQWVRLLDVLQMNVEYTRCVGAELDTVDGRRILDFISGYCVHNVGHNHPRVIDALKQELDRNGPAMLQSHVSDLAGELAARLCERAGGRLTKAFFDSSGSEGIETVLKFARAHTGRPGILYAAGGFHGLTCGALSLMANPFWRDGFGPFLPNTEAVPFGDLDELTRRLATGRFAAFILEPVQAESGVLVPPREYPSRRRRSAGATERCWCSTRFRPGCTAQATFLRLITLRSSRIWSCWPRRSAAAWSRAARC